MGVVFERLQDRGRTPDFSHSGIKAWLARRLEVNKLVDQQLGHDGAGDAVKSVGALLPALDRTAMGSPNIGRKRQGAGIQQVAIFQRFVVLVVVGGEAQRARLDSHVDVFGHQDDLSWSVLLAKGLHHAKDLVVCFSLRQAGGQCVTQQLRLEEQFAASRAVTGRAERQTRRDVSAVVPGQCIKRAAGLPGIPRHFGHALFMAIELFEHDHGQKNVVFFEAKQAHWVMQQDVGVQHEQFGWPDML